MGRYTCHRNSSRRAKRRQWIADTAALLTRDEVEWIMGIDSRAEAATILRAKSAARRERRLARRK